MIRPSNSGIATCAAASSGDSPSSLSAQARRLVVRHSACRIGTSSPASAPTSQASSSPPAARQRGPGAARGEHGHHEHVGRAQRRRSARARRPAATSSTPAAAARPRPRSPGTAPRRTRCSRPRGGPGSRAPPTTGPSTSRASRSSTPQAGVGCGGAKPYPVSSTVSQRNACSSARLAGPPWARYACASAHTPPLTVDSSISSASGTCSPPSTTTGRGPASSASRPSSQARRPPSRRTTTRSVPSSRSGRSSGGEPGGVAEPVGLAARPGAEQIGVRRGQQQNDGHAEIPPSGSSPRVAGCHDGRSLLAPGSTLAPAFPPGRAVAIAGVRSPVTVAGPRRIRTGFLRTAACP